VAAIFARFKEIGDKKKFVYDDDLSALVEGQITEVPETWSLDYLSVTSGNRTVPTATVRLQKLDGKKERPCRTPASATARWTRLEGHRPPDRHAGQS
jgi:hypothetical protein